MMPTITRHLIIAARRVEDKANDKKFALSVSPMTYVNKSSPPAFNVYDDADQFMGFIM